MADHRRRRVDESSRIVPRRGVRVVERVEHLRQIAHLGPRRSGGIAERQVRANAYVVEPWLHRGDAQSIDAKAPLFAGHLVRNLDELAAVDGRQYIRAEYVSGRGSFSTVRALSPTDGRSSVALTGA